MRIVKNYEDRFKINQQFNSEVVKELKDFQGSPIEYCKALIQKELEQMLIKDEVIDVEAMEPTQNQMKEKIDAIDIKVFSYEERNELKDYIEGGWNIAQ